MFLSEDDTTVTANDKQQQKIQINLDSIGKSLKSNSLALNFEKTGQVNLISNTRSTFEIDGTQIESRPINKQLGVHVDFKLCSNTHINVVLEKRGKQSGVVSNYDTVYQGINSHFSIKQTFSQQSNMAYSFMVAVVTLAYYLL